MNNVTEVHTEINNNNDNNNFEVNLCVQVLVAEERGRYSRCSEASL